MTGRHFEDALNLLCGKELGSGIHRTVFEYRIDPTLVVKVEKDDGWRQFANVREHQFWADHQYYQPVAQWLAPCRYLSPDGYISLQQRARPVIEGDALPDKLPKFLTDIKRENFGWIDGRLVCVDYAAVVACTPSTRLKGVIWG